MSVFICADETIFLLVSAASKWRLLKGIFEDNACKMLRAENIMSVNYRYPDSKCIAPIGLFQPVEIIIPGHVGKAAHCYTYQSSEHDDWIYSPAARLIERIVYHACTFLPKYEDNRVWR